MNRRKFTRHPISISALLHPRKGRSWLCTIRDFCEMGVLLAGTGGNRSLTATGSESKPGDKVDLHFSVPTETGEKHYRLVAVIARLTDQSSGMGVRFVEPLKEEIFQTLMDFAVASGVVAADLLVEDGEAGVLSEISEDMLRDKRIPERDANKVRKELVELTRLLIGRLSTQFFESSDSILLEKARSAGTNAGQMMYFEALDQLALQSSALSKQFGDDVLGQIKKVSNLENVLEKRRRQQSGSSVGSNEKIKLSLVDTNEFEEWLAIAEIISKAESQNK
ncbi:MAG: DUF1631 family protein, partial [Pseudomonadales bacterium]|nr:DUF1631 family protein [Pseudomonadales bacterium]